jgi:hypothetical protein
VAAVPCTRSPLFLYPLLLLVCGVMAAPPLVNHFRDGVRLGWPVFADTPPGHQFPAGLSKNKDYPLWYFVGRTVVEDATLRERTGADWPLYPTAPDATFPFMYPPFAALCLGVLSLLGPTGMLIALIVLNVACVAVVIELGVRIVAGTGNVSVWLRLIPAAVCLFFLNDMFLLGQPNLGLLCLVLGGLMMVRTDKPRNQILGGGLFALATAIKAFPAVVIVYLLWRRQWLAAASMVGFCLLFFVAVPAGVRGWDRSMGELKTWADGMLFRQGEKGHGQRPEQSVGWRNQSLFGVANRLLRDGNAKAEETASGGAEPMFVNVVNVGYRGAMVGAVAAAGLLGLGFVLVMPRRAARTRATDAAEFGMLVLLMTVGTPYAFGYYFVWLLYPLTVLVHHGLKGDRVAWGCVAGVLVLFALSGLQAFKWYEPMAYGSLFWAAAVALVGCGWVTVRSRGVNDEPPASGVVTLDRVSVDDPLARRASESQTSPANPTTC